MTDGTGGRAAELASLTARAVDMVTAWEARFGDFVPHPSLRVDPAAMASAWDAFAARMADHRPFFHPRYAGQMLKPPHPVAVASYLAAMIINPNNHALDGGPGTSALEVEVVGELAAMFGLPDDSLGHLTASGTIANLEALWVARELHPGRAIVCSEEAHYTHVRMCRLLGIEPIVVPADADGCIGLDAVDAACRRGDVGTVVLTPGTTGLGAVDRVDEALALRERHGVRLHADAAYGGFFTLLARGDAPLVEPAPFAALAQCDSVVVDPHKHGLQPYGCGAVLFADPSVARLYAHDSPYTYFTPADLHLGEISLECSRPGAAAAALWLTLRVLPLDCDAGLGPILAAGRRAALDWHGRLAGSDVLAPLIAPALDIVTMLPRAASVSAAGAVARAVLDAGMGDAEDPVHLSVLRARAERLRRAAPDLEVDASDAEVLRSVLRKPEHETAVAWLHARVEDLATRALAARA